MNPKSLLGWEEFLVLRATYSGEFPFWECWIGVDWLNSSISLFSRVALPIDGDQVHVRELTQGILSAFIPSDAFIHKIIEKDLSSSMYITHDLPWEHNRKTQQSLAGLWIRGVRPDTAEGAALAYTQEEIDDEVPEQHAAIAAVKREFSLHSAKHGTYSSSLLWICRQGLT